MLARLQHAIFQPCVCPEQHNKHALQSHAHTHTRRTYYIVPECDILLVRTIIDIYKMIARFLSHQTPASGLPRTTPTHTTSIKTNTRTSINHTHTYTRRTYYIVPEREHTACWNNNSNLAARQTKHRSCPEQHKRTPRATTPTHTHIRE